MDYSDFAWALRQLMAGKKLTREGWNGADQFVFMVPGSTFNVNRAPLLGIYPEDTEITYLPHLDLRNAQGKVGTWTPSNGDLFADDWELVD